jgi:hypothetical protein
MRRPHFNRLIPLTALLGLCLTTSLARAQQATAPAATEPATQSATQESEAAKDARDRKEYEDRLRNLPTVRVSSLRDVIQFAIENDDLVIRTSIPPTDSSAVVVEGSPSLITVTTARGDDAHSPYVPQTFTFIRRDYPQAGGIVITDASVVGGQRVAVSRGAEDEKQSTNVQLIQDNAFLEEGDDRIRFYVQEMHNDEPIVDLKLSAVNVIELRRRYPAETMRYLEPLFREFGQSSVLFQVNTRAAWQVLGMNHEPPPEVAKQVGVLLKQLNAPEAKDREAALKELEKLGEQAALVLMKRDRTQLSEEQRTRVETFLAGYTPLSEAEATKMRSDPEFLLLALSADDPVLPGLALERLKEVAKQPITFDANATGQARNDAIAKLRAQLLPATTRPATRTVRKSELEAP